MKKIFAVVSFVGFLACSKSGNDPEPGPGPDPNPNPNPNVELTITTVTPDNADVVPVTINGTGFSTTAANNEVRFGTLQATVQTATATKLDVVLPATISAGDHDVTVKVGTKTATKTKGFHLKGWIVSNFAGNGNRDFKDGPGAEAEFVQPFCITSDAAGNFYVGDQFKVRKIAANGDVSTVAGFGRGLENGDAADAKFQDIMSIAVATNNDLYVADQGNHVIRKISNGQVTTFAGKAGVRGAEDGIGINASFFRPYGLAINAAGTHLYVADQSNELIRRINLNTQQVETLAGNDSENGSVDGRGTLAGFSTPAGIKFDAAGNLIITEPFSGKVRMMEPDLDVTTITPVGAGNNSGASDVDFDRAGNRYVTYYADHRIKKITPANVETWWAGTMMNGLDDGPANLVHFEWPQGIRIIQDAQGKDIFFIVDTNKRKIKKIEYK